MAFDRHILPRNAPYFRNAQHAREMLTKELSCPASAYRNHRSEEQSLQLRSILEQLLSLLCSWPAGPQPAGVSLPIGRLTAPGFSLQCRLFEVGGSERELRGCVSQKGTDGTVKAEVAPLKLEGIPMQPETPPVSAEASTTPTATRWLSLWSFMQHIH